MLATVNPGDITYAWLGSIVRVEKDEKDPNVRYVWGKATDGTLDSDDQIVDPSFAKKAMAEWYDSAANVRQMHSTNLPPAGKAVLLESHPDGEYVRTKVVEPTAVRLVDEGVYTGYSVGISRPRIVRSNKASGGVINGGRIVEISLVDRPANPAAKFVALGQNDARKLAFVGKSSIVPDGYSPIVAEPPAPKPPSRLRRGRRVTIATTDGEAITGIVKTATSVAVKLDTRAYSDTDDERSVLRDDIVEAKAAGVTHTHMHLDPESGQEHAHPHTHAWNHGDHSTGHAHAHPQTEDSVADETQDVATKAAETPGADCATCSGSGKIMEGNRDCPDCSGSGKAAAAEVEKTDGGCDKCKGSGFVAEAACDKCGGTGKWSGAPVDAEVTPATLPKAKKSKSGKAFKPFTAAPAAPAAPAPAEGSATEEAGEAPATEAAEPEEPAAPAAVDPKKAAKRAAKAARKMASKVSTANPVGPEVSWVIKRLHDYTCAAYAPEDVAEFYPSIEKNGVAAAMGPGAKSALYSMLVKEIQEDAGKGDCADSIKSLAKAYHGVVNFLDDEDADKGASVGGILMAAKSELNEAFKADNLQTEAKPTGYPKPAEDITPGRFKRPYISAGHQQQKATAHKPDLTPPTHPISADDFKRGPVTGGHQRYLGKFQDLHDAIADWRPDLCLMDANGSFAFDRQPAETFQRGNFRDLIPNSASAQPRSVEMPPTAKAPGEKTKKSLSDPKVLNKMVAAAQEPLLEKITRMENEYKRLSNQYEEIAGSPDPERSAHRGVTGQVTRKLANAETTKAERKAARKSERKANKIEYLTSLTASPDPGTRLEAQQRLSDMGVNLGY